MKINKKIEEYHCPKCGTVEWRIDVIVPGFEGKYYLVCYCRWLKENIPKLEEISDKNNH